jgi:hypothetical protein
LVAEQLMHGSVGGVGQVDGAVDFGQPDVDAVGVQLDDDAAGLPGGEGAFELADHHRVERSVRVRGGAQQGGGLRAVGLVIGSASRRAGRV